MKKIFTLTLSFLLAIGLYACANNQKENKYENADYIKLNDTYASFNGAEIKEFDYMWHVDPTSVHEDVKNAPAEYYTGIKPKTDDACYIDYELYYYPKLDENKFKLIDYDGDKEWAYYYEDGENNDYIFSTLPSFQSDNKVPTYMMHTEEEAKNNKVLHITKPGTYVLEGKWHGQIFVDLGDKDDTFKDENSKVTIILNNIDITCDVAPAIIFNSAYECDNDWQNKDDHSYEIDTINAGVNIIVGDDTTNNVKGANIFRMLKPVYKDEDSKDKTQKKIRKVDAAFYSYVSMNIDGENKGNGILNIESNFEGLDTELHLTINGGNINIESQDDGINVNEDDVSVVNFKGGNILINAAKGAEGDGIDSNGYIVVDGVNLTINNIRMPDNALDSSSGVIYKKGNIVVNGKEVKLEPGEYEEISENGVHEGFKRGPRDNFNPGDNQFDFFDIDIKDIKEKVNSLNDDIDINELLKTLGLDFMNGQGMNMPPNKNKPNNDSENPTIDIPNIMDTKINIKEFKEKINKLDDNASINDILSILGIDMKEFDRQVPPNDKPLETPK